MVQEEEHLKKFCCSHSRNKESILDISIFWPYFADYCTPIRAFEETLANILFWFSAHIGTETE